jgi:hypothetical protein
MSTTEVEWAAGGSRRRHPKYAGARPASKCTCEQKHLFLQPKKSCVPLRLSGQLGGLGIETPSAQVHIQPQNAFVNKNICSYNQKKLSLPLRLSGRLGGLGTEIPCAKNPNYCAIVKRPRLKISLHLQNAIVYTS